jgi:hypothetical protein
VWCSVLVDGIGLCFMFWAFDIRCILYYYIIYYIILFLFLPLLFPSSLLFSSPNHLLLSLPFSPSSCSDPNIHSILVGTYIYLFILFYTLLLFIFHTHLLWSILPIPIFILYLSVLTYTYLYSRLISSFQQFWPRTFYRSGWLRCVVVICIRLGLRLSWWMVLTLGVILYIILYYYYTYTIISYTCIILLLYTIHILLLYLILYSPPFLFYTPLFLILPLPSQYSFYTCRYLHILIYIPSNLSKQAIYQY